MRFNVIETVGIAERPDGSASNIHYRHERQLAESTVSRLIREYRHMASAPYGRFTDHRTDDTRIVRAAVYFSGVLNIHELQIKGE